jgi:hypothetical protein
MPGPYLLQCRIIFPSVTGSVSLVARNGFLPDTLRFSGPNAWIHSASSGPLTGLHTLRFPFVKTDSAPETILEFSASGSSSCEILDWSLQPDYARQGPPSNATPDTARAYPEMPAPSLTWSQKSLRLQSFSLPLKIKTGESLPIGFRFELLKPDLPRFDELVIFVHLIGVDGSSFALPGIPFPCCAFGQSPLNLVLANLPAELPAGTYRVRIGLYNGRTLMRLPVATEASQVHLRHRAAEWTSLIVE